MSIKFDRFRLAIPSSAVEILNPDAFSHSVSKDGVATHHRFEQKAPFYYQILIDCLKNTTYLEFSGKSLMENYTSLIQASNIIEWSVHASLLR